jgi:NTE family protein
MGLGPVVGGVFTEWFSWRGAFLVNVPLVAAAMLAAPGVLVESDRHPGRRLPDPIGAVLFALAASGVTFALAQVADWGVTDVRVAGAGLGATLAGALFVRRCLTVSEPLLDLAILRSRQVAAVTVVTVLYSCAFFGLLFSFVLFLAGSWHLSLIRIGAALVPMAATVLLLTVRVGQLANRVGFRLPLTAGTVCMASGLVLSARAFGGQQFELRWVPIAVLIGVGIGLCYPLLGAAAVAGLDARHLAAATALNQCARQLGAALGVATTVAVLGGQPAPPLGRFHIAWLVCAGFCAVAGLTARTVNR